MWSSLGFVAARRLLQRLTSVQSPNMRQSLPTETIDEIEISSVVPDAASRISPRPAAPETGKPFVVEYYYKAKWGYADEFLRLFKKNHYPLLKKQVEMGRMLKVWMDQPRYHTTEDGRWDYRVTIVFKNSAVANEPFDEDSAEEAALARPGHLRERRAAAV